MGTDEHGDVLPEHRVTLRPAVGLTENLPKRDLEQITVQAIKTHRRLRDAAEAKYEEWRRSPPPVACDTSGPNRIAYVTAMIDMHAQQAVVSTLLNVLGHVPPVPAD